MKNALSVPAFALALFSCLCTDASLSAQSNADVSFIDRPGIHPEKESSNNPATEKTGAEITDTYSIGMRMIATAGRYYQQKGMPEKFNRYRWEYHEVRDDEHGCFALPDGRIAVSDGLLRSVRRHDQLAYVIGHAIGHVLAGHKPKNRNQALSGSLLPFGERASDGFENFERLALGIDPAYRTDDEQEADRISLTLMQLAGFDPGESLVFWENMRQRAEQIGTPPGAKIKSASDNLQALKNLIPFIQAQYQPLPQEEYIKENKIAAATPEAVATRKPRVQTQKVPSSGAYFFVLADVVAASEVQSKKFEPLQEIGPVYRDETTIGGLNYTRLLIGDCPNPEVAKQKKERLIESGFPNALAVGYLDGKRTKILY